MAIRTPSVITFDLPIEELGKTIKIRPLSVGEQKKIVLLLEMKDPAAIINGIVEVVEGITLGEVDVKTLPAHLVDYIFLKSFIRSSGSVAKAEYSCGGSKLIDRMDENNEPTGEKDEVPCNTNIPINIDLNNAVLWYPETYAPSKTIDLGDGIMIKLKVPSFEKIRKLEKVESVISLTDRYIFAGIEAIVDGDSISTPGVDFTFDESVQWLNQLSTENMEKIAEFFSEFPDLRLKANVTCPTCGRKDGFELKGLDDFFL